MTAPSALLLRKQLAGKNFPEAPGQDQSSGPVFPKDKKQKGGTDWLVHDVFSLNLG